MIIVVIGAGAVGLAISAALAKEGHEVLILERHPKFGFETSSRSSEVIHAGIYYESQSLKAKLCVRGRELLYERAHTHDIPHAKVGKYIVATDSNEEAAVQTLYEQGLANGAGALELLSGDEITRKEPNVVAKMGLFSPETGIFDTHIFMQGLLSEAESHGATLVTHTEATDFSKMGPGWTIHTRGAEGEEYDIACDLVINAAGLFADKIAAKMGVDVDEREWKQSWIKGDYFSVHMPRAKLSEALIYPAPNKAGLGVHITFDMGRRYRFGPDANPTSELDYKVSESKRDVFAQDIQRYMPGVQAADLDADYAGIRPKLSQFNRKFQDFIIQGPLEGPQDGAIHLIGIESPGLTAALAIAEMVAKRIALL